MEKTRIFFAYKHTDEPWGGANNFIKALNNEFQKNSDYLIHQDINLESDILFFNQLSRGPGSAEYKRRKKYRFSEIKKLKRRSNARLIVRAVNLNLNSNQPTWKSFLPYIIESILIDLETIRLLNFADFVVFQSEFQKALFKKWGYVGRKNVVIHNGAPSIFENNNFTVGDAHAPLRLVSNSNYKSFKKHEIIAKMSLLDGVKIIHVGTWSEKIKNHNVDLRGILSHEEIVEIYRNSDLLLHPAKLDMCPNAIIEALLFGLPVLYNDCDKGSSREIVRGNGIPIDENDLEETIQSAKEKFNALKQGLAGNRNYYSIARAAAMYDEVFKKFKK